MLDYHLVEAFAAVLDEGGFERASERLFITQSAVSQRIKQLEDALGKALIIRETPPRATEAGEQLLRYYRQISSLEQETLDAICTKKKEGGFPHIPLAVNTDSLAVWFMDAILPFVQRTDMTLEVLTEGHERTLDLLRAGAVVGCVSSSSTTIQGCSSTLIGTIRYVLVASSSFAKRWFPEGFGREAVAKAPIVNLDRNDMLQYRILFKLFGEPQLMPPAHYVPTANQYHAAVTAGIGYGLVPAIKAAAELNAGSLVELDKRARMGITLYWHRLNRYSSLLKGITDAVLAEGGRILADTSHGGDDAQL